MCSFNAHIYDQPSETSSPSIDKIPSFNVLPSVTGWHNEDVSFYNVTLTSGHFAVGVEINNNLTCPFIGIDQNPPISNRSWVYDFPASNWISVGNVGFNGNLMIRAEVEYPAPTTIPTTIPFTTSVAGGACTFSSIYGEDSEEVMLLRYLRDAVLSQTPAGKELIRLYYEWSPVLLKAMEEDEELREEVKETIDDVLELISNE